jgi:hypothetical protein
VVVKENVSEGLMKHALCGIMMARSESIHIHERQATSTGVTLSTKITARPELVTTLLYLSDAIYFRYKML